MSQDYPDYPRIRERSRLLGRLWMIGYMGYYIGLLVAVGALVNAGGALIFGGLGHLLAPENESLRHWWRALIPCVVAIPIGVVIFLVSSRLKQVAYRRSARPGRPTPRPRGGSRSPSRSRGAGSRRAFGKCPAEASRPRAG